MRAPVISSGPCRLKSVETLMEIPKFWSLTWVSPRNHKWSHSLETSWSAQQLALLCCGATPCLTGLCRCAHQDMQLLCCTAQSSPTTVGRAGRKETASASLHLVALIDEANSQKKLYFSSFFFFEFYISVYFWPLQHPVSNNSTI